jgi:hypothetical protein
MEICVCHSYYVVFITFLQKNIAFIDRFAVVCRSVLSNVDP